MEDTPPISEAPPSAAAPNGADTNSQPGAGTLSIDQINTSELTLDQLDSLLTGGNVDIPLKQPGGEGKTDTPPAAPAPAAPAAVDTPASVQAPPEVAAPAAPAAPVVPDGEQPVQTQEDIDAAAAAQAAAEAAAAAPAPAAPAPAVDARMALILGVYEHAKSQGAPITLAEAEARVDGPKPEPIVVAPPIDLSKVVTDLRTELETVTQQLDDSGESLSNQELRNLQRRQTQLDTQIVIAEERLADATTRAQELRAEASQQAQAARDKAYDDAVAMYPEAADDKTEFGAAVAQRIEEMKNPLHPDHKILEAVSAPLAVVKIVAAERGVAPRKVAATTAAPVTSPATAPKVVTPTPRQVMSPAPGSKTAVPVTQPVEDAKTQFARAMTEGTLEELDAIQGGANPAAALAALVR